MNLSKGAGFRSGKRPVWRRAFYALPLLALVGCGSGRPPLNEVTGTVTYQGNPVEGAQVMFMPDGGRTATGTTDPSGRYALTTFENEDGALVGNHRVTIVKNVALPATPENPYPGARNELPPKYALPDQSGLTAEVKASGSNEIDFQLVP